MFSSEKLKQIALKHQNTLIQLGEIEKILTDRFVKMEKAIRAFILSVASGEPLLLVGPPGTAKSRLIRAFCGLIELLDEENPEKGHPEYFEYLLTPFTEPGELFGYYNISKAAKGGVLKRDDKNMMQNAKVIYLDEIFNGSSAILNSILAFMNERIFHDRGKRKKVKMQCLFAATNQIPEKSELRAIFDRLVLRCEVNNVKEIEDISKLLQKGWLETYGIFKKQKPFKNILEKTVELRETIQEYSTNNLLDQNKDNKFFNMFTWMVHHARQFGFSDMSNRRLIKIAHIMLIHAMYEWVLSEKKDSEISLGVNEFLLLPRYFLDRMDDESIDKMERAAYRYEEKY